MATLATAVAVDAAAAVVTVEARSAREKSLTCEMLLLPLRHNGPAYDRILGSFALARTALLARHRTDRPAVSCQPPADLAGRTADTSCAAPTDRVDDRAGADPLSAPATADGAAI